MGQRHTKGPWAVDPDLHDFDFGAPQKGGTRAQLCRYVYAPDGGGGRIAQCFANCLVTTTAELEANARLIAAAPELLEALQNWLGSPNDPKAGWQGSGGSRELYACPYCNAKHGDCTQIPHSATCPIPPARAAIAKATGAL